MNNQQILYFLSHQPNPRIVKQINFLSKDFKVTVIYFQRKNLADLSNSIQKKINLIPLDYLNDSSYKNRISKYIKHIFIIKNLLKKIKPTNIMVNNIDTLLLLLICTKFKTKTIIMQISDAREYIFQKSFKSLVLKQLEKIFFKYFISKMVLTSPKFFSEYYCNFFKKPVFILENKPLLTNLPKKLPKKTNTDSIKIGIVGLFLRNKEYCELVDELKNNKNVEIHFYGLGKYEDLIKEFEKKHKNIFYHGPFNFFEDISKIYSSIDLIFAIYDSEIKNNTLALPNKLYEAMYFQTPILVSSNTYLSDIVSKYEIGYCLKYNDREMIRKIIKDFKIDSIKFKQSFKNLSEDLFLGDTDYNQFKNYLKT
jgi:succinoglycan biosynthesis protein ExoL